MQLRREEEAEMQLRGGDGEQLNYSEANSETPASLLSGACVEPYEKG